MSMTDEYGLGDDPTGGLGDNPVQNITGGIFDTSISLPLVGQDSFTGTGLLRYNIYTVALVSGEPVKTVLQSSTNSGVYEASTGFYIVAGGVSVRGTGTYYTEWGNSATGQVFGVGVCQSGGIATGKFTDSV